MNSESQNMHATTESPSDGSLSLSPYAGSATYEDSFPEGGTRAWMVAIGNACILCATLGFVNSFGVFQAYYQDYQLSSNSPSAIAWIGSLQTFFILACGAIGGPIFDRYGSRVIYPAAVLYLLGLMLTSVCSILWQFILTQGILTGIASGMLLTPAMAATPQYFSEKRDLAMGLAVAGSSIGGVIFPVALGGLMQNENIGFGWAVRICAFIALGLLGFACVAIKPRLPPRNTRFWKLEAFMDPTYVLMCTAAFLLFLAQFQPFFFVPTYALQHGMSERMAAYLVPIINAASFPGRVIPALLSMRVGRFNVLIYACISSGIIVICWSSARSNAAIIVWSAVYGFCSGALTSGMSVAFTGSARDPNDYGTYIGMGLTTASVGVLVGPPISGALSSRYHGFTQVSILAGTLMLLGGFLVALIKILSGHRLLSAN